MTTTPKSDRLVFIASMALSWISPLLLIFFILATFADLFQSLIIAMIAVAVWRSMPFLGPRLVVSFCIVLFLSFIAMYLHDEYMIEDSEFFVVLFLLLGGWIINIYLWIRRGANQQSKPETTEFLDSTLQNKNLVILFFVIWTMIIALTALLSLPVFLHRSIPLLLLMIPFIIFITQAFHRFYLMSEKLEKELLFLAVAISVGLPAALMRFYFGNPLLIVPFLCLLLASLVLPLIVLFSRNDRIRLAATAFVFVIAGIVLLIVPYTPFPTSDLQIPYFAQTPVWRQEGEDYKAVIKAYDMRHMEIAGSIGEIRSSTSFPDLSVPEHVFSESGIYLDAAPDNIIRTGQFIDQDEIVYSPETASYGRLNEKNVVENITPVHPPEAKISGAGVSPDGRYFMFRDVGDYDKNESHLSIYDSLNSSSTTLTIPYYRYLRGWIDDETIMLILSPDMRRSVTAGTRWRSYLLNVRTAEKTLLESGIGVEEWVMDYQYGKFFSVSLPVISATDDTSGEDTVARITDYRTGKQRNLPWPVSRYNLWKQDLSQPLVYLAENGKEESGKVLVIIELSGEVRMLPWDVPVGGHPLSLSPDGKHLLFYQVQKHGRGSLPFITLHHARLGEDRILDSVFLAWLSGASLMNFNSSKHVSWSPDSKRFSIECSAFSPLGLYWWVVFRTPSDILTFVGQQIDIMNGTRGTDCGTGLIIGRPFPYMPQMAILTLPAEE